MRSATSTRFVSLLTLCIEILMQTPAQAFVIYCFFDLLVAYLGGERSLLILLHGRPPKYPVFPGSIFWREVDVSDPYTFLFLKRGVLRQFSPSSLPFISSLTNLSNHRIRPSETHLGSGYHHLKSDRQIQRRRSSSRFRISLRQFGV